MSSGIHGLSFTGSMLDAHTLEITPNPTTGPRSVQPRSARIAASARRVLRPLLPIIDHPAARDLLVHVRDGRGEIWIDAGAGLRRIPSWECAPEAVEELARELIAAGNRHIDERHPIADVHLGGGVRVHAVLSPVSARGATISIRLPTRSPLTFHALAQRGLCVASHRDRLLTALRNKENLLVVGGAGAGKTTLLAALLGTLPPSQRIVTIEDVAELQIQHPHHISLETRQPNTEGVGEVTLEHLLRAALRMRPDRIVLGECRGAELVTLLNALNTGHNGGAGTLHASSLNDVVARLEALGALAGLTPSALHRQVASAIHLVVHLVRDDSGAHRVAGIGVPLLRHGRLSVEVVGE